MDGIGSFQVLSSRMTSESQGWHRSASSPFVIKGIGEPNARASSPPFAKDGIEDFKPIWNEVPYKDGIRELQAPKNSIGELQVIPGTRSPSRMAPESFTSFRKNGIGKFQVLFRNEVPVRDGISEQAFASAGFFSDDLSLLRLRWHLQGRAFGPVLASAFLAFQG